MIDPRKEAEVVRSYAEHFTARDWVFTTDDKVKRIRYEDDFKGYYHPWQRVKRAARELVRVRRTDLDRLLPGNGVISFLVMKWAMIVIYLRTDRHLPDGSMQGAAIHTHWMEDGIYLQLMQPQVASKVCDFLEAEPDNPYAQAIAAEINRVRKLKPKKEEARG